MNKKAILSSMVGVALSTNFVLLFADEAGQEGRVATNFNEIFDKAAFSGQSRLGYLMHNPEASGADTTDDFAIGGQLKIESASWNGFSFGGAFYTSHSISEPDDDDFNDEMSGPDQHYDLLAEAYFNYSVDGFNVRLGRQRIDTPFADSDDIRMTPHTFEALVGSYDFGNGFNLVSGWLTRWQGVDAGFPGDGDFGDLVDHSDGTFMLGGIYGGDVLEANLWYYGVADVANTFYGDVMLPITLSESMELTLGVQASVQSDDTNSKTRAVVGSEVDGTLYSVMAELAVNNFTISAAWDHADMDRGGVLFGGFGSEPFFTNIDTLVANEFAAGQDADSYTLSLGYDFGEMGAEGLGIGYTYGHYEGGDDPYDSKADAEAEEHNFTLDYAISDRWFLDAVYVISEDKEHSADTDWDYDRFQTRLTYTF